MDTTAQACWLADHVPTREAVESLQAVGVLGHPGLVLVPKICPEVVCALPQSMPCAAPLTHAPPCETGFSVAVNGTL